MSVIANCDEDGRRTPSWLGQIGPRGQDAQRFEGVGSPGPAPTPGQSRSGPDAAPHPVRMAGIRGPYDPDRRHPAQTPAP